MTLAAALRRGQPNCHDHGVESTTSKPRAREEREPATVAAEEERVRNGGLPESMMAG